jgi:hypothetical protein
VPMRETCVRRGFTVTELIMAMFVSMIVCGALVVLASDARTMFQVQPETTDLLQRARVGHELLRDELVSAGGGLQAGSDPQPLVHWIPPVLPYVRAVTGASRSDPEAQAFGDRVTLITVPDLAPQASIDGVTSPAGDLVPIVRDASCGSAGIACGFAEGQRVLLFDSSPAFDIATVRGVSPSSLRLDAGSTSKTYRLADRAHVATVRVTTFSLDETRRQLRRALGDGVDVPALDEVVELSFRYFGDPYPPESPRPPPGESNCLFDADGRSRLPVLASDDGALVELPPVSLADGPFCGVSPYRFDADLYRIRRVHVRLRLQATSAWLRGLDPRVFRMPGRSIGLSLQVPDMIAEFDIAPRSLQVR